MTLQEACKEAGIKLILGDLDDTFIRTNRLFMQQIAIFNETGVKLLPHIQVKDLEESLFRANRQAYATHSVDRASWKEVIRILTEEYGEESHVHIAQAISHIERVYTLVPDLREGASELLKALGDIDIPFGIVTHADGEWTELKVRTHNLDQYALDIRTVPTTEYKGPTHWKQAIDAFAVEPGQTLVIGDSIKSDMIPAYEAGVRMLIWVDNEESYSPYREGDLPPQTKSVTHLDQVIPLIISNPWK